MMNWRHRLRSQQQRPHAVDSGEEEAEEEEKRKSSAPSTSNSTVCATEREKKRKRRERNREIKIHKPDPRTPIHKHTQTYTLSLAQYMHVSIEQLTHLAAASTRRWPLRDGSAQPGSSAPTDTNSARWRTEARACEGRIANTASREMAVNITARGAQSLCALRKEQHKPNRS